MAPPAFPPPPPPLWPLALARRNHVVTVHGAPAELREALADEWSQCTPDEAHAKLSKPDVAVTNQRDKVQQLKKLTALTTIDQNNFERVCLYLLRCADFMSDPDDLHEMLAVAYEVYKGQEQYPDAMRVAIRCDDTSRIGEVLSLCTDATTKKQLCLLLARHRVNFDYSEDEEMNELIHDKVIVATLESIKLKNGKSALSIYDRATCNLHINPSGKFIIGGPQGDAGLTGHKIIIDTYGGWGAHGGGAFSGKDPTKVDRSAAYACRWMAKSIVKSGLCKRALVQLSYAIGVAKPLSLFVETYGSECGNLTPDSVTDIVKLEFDCRPGALARDLQLRQPKYNVTAAYCHFGREPYTVGDLKFFAWEDAKDLSKYATMSAAAVDKEIASKKKEILAKWVD